MSNHLITQPNFTQIPNVIFDHWMNVLSPAEFKVLLCICRKTFGWSKKRDPISIRQIVLYTGLSKSSIPKIIKALEDHSLIITHREKTEWGDDAPNEYEIHVHDVEKQGGSPLSRQQVVHSVDHGVVHSVDTQKKDYTKERHTKELGPKVQKDASNLHADFFFSIENQKFEGIQEKDLEAWKQIYPNVPLQKELLKMEQWCRANPTEAKLKKKWRKFVTVWLNKEESKLSNQKAYRESKGMPVQEQQKNEVMQRVEENRKWSEKNLRNIPFADDRSISLSDNCVSIKNGREFIPVGYAELNFKEIIKNKLNSWGLYERV